MTNILQLLILFYCHMIQVSGVFKWTVVGKATDYGQNVTLFCHVPNCCPEDAGWDRWTPQQRTLFIDLKTGRPNKKYDGRIFKNGYTLIIQNLTKDDLNVSYSCLYGVTLGDRQFLLEENVFTFVDTSSAGRFYDGEIAGTIVGVLVVVTIVVLLVYFWKHKNSQKVDKGSGPAYHGVPSNDSKARPKWKPDCCNGGRGSADSVLTSNNREVKEESKPDCAPPAEQKEFTHNKVTFNDHKDKAKFETARETLSESDRKSFMERIQSGHEVRKYVRIQVIGKDGVGKTSLVRRLLNQDLEGVTSTDGIDISRKCHIKESDGTWIFDNDQTEMEKIGNRILYAVQLQQMDNKTNNDERLIADLNSFETEKNETPKYDIMLTVDETKQHLSDRVTDEAETLNINETVEVNDNDQVTTFITNIPGTSNKNSDDNQLNEVHTINFNADKTTPNINTNYNADHITEAMVDKMDEITLYVKKKKETMIDKGLVECGIWDFAGQKEYYPTHQTFLTPHAIYLLVADITDDIKPIQKDQQLEAESSGDYIDFWLDSIHCYCKDIKDCTGNAIKTSVIMVFTGIDKLKVPEENLKIKTKEYETKFLGIFGRQEKGSHISSKVHFISNIKSPKEDFRNLREHISEIAKDMGFFFEELPTKWIQLENTLEILKDVKEKGENGYCEKLENIEKLAKTILIGKEELLRFLNYQHKIGNVIFFYDKCDYIILEPNWLVNCFRCLICDDVKKPCNMTELYALKYRGILSDDVIDKLFSKVPELMFRQYKTHILKVMEKFDIIVKPNSMNSYYIPCMITNVSSLIDIKNAFEVEDHHCTPWLVLAFTFLPIAYFNHILFMYIRKKTVCEVMSDTGEERPAIYAGKTVVYLDTTEQSKLVICFSRNAISLQIWNSHNMGDITYQDIVSELCSKIVDLEMKLCHKLEYKIQSKCRTGDYFSSSGRISHEELNALCVGDQYFCAEHKCRHNKDDIENTWFKHLESTAESTDEKAPKIKSVNSPQEIVAEPNQRELENTVNSAHNTSGEAADVQKKQVISAETDILPDQFIEIKESTAESTDEMVPTNESVNSPQEIVAEPNQPELENTGNSAHNTSGEAADVQKKQALSAETDILPDQFIEIKESTAESTDEIAPKIKSVISPQEIVAEPNQPELEESTAESTDEIAPNIESVNSPQEIVAELNQPDLERSSAKSTDEIAPKIKSVNSPKEILAEPNQSEIAEDLLDARCITDDAAKYSNTKLLITAQKDVSSDLEQKLPRYSEYESMDTRLNSFESWSSSKKPTREDLARAGFFYLEGDKVKCFYCAGILMQWKEDDVPIEEHKRYYPACPFIKNIDK